MTQSQKSHAEDKHPAESRVNVSYCQAAAGGAEQQSSGKPDQDHLDLIITDFHTLVHVRHSQWIMQTADLNLYV